MTIDGLIQNFYLQQQQVDLEIENHRLINHLHENGFIEGSDLDISDAELVNNFLSTF